MPLSRTFKATIKDLVQKDARFRAALLSEGVKTLLSGDVGTAKSLLRDYINATLGFEDLARRTGTPPKSLMRMFGPRGNPSARNLSAVLKHLQHKSGISLRVLPAGQGRRKAG